jgi:hypothetical protein
MMNSGIKVLVIKGGKTLYEVAISRRAAKAPVARDHPWSGLPGNASFLYQLRDHDIIVRGNDSIVSYCTLEFV